MAVDATEGAKIGNYKVYNSSTATTDLAAGGSAVVQADGMSVLVTLGSNLTNGATAKAVVGSSIVDATINNILVSDTTIPTVVGITVTGPSTFTVEYSEPITSLSNAEYTVDNGNYIVTGTAANGSNKVDVSVGVNLTDGDHSVKLNGTNVTDYAGYKVVPVTMSFAKAADTTLPTVTVKSATPTSVVLTFSKPIANTNNANVLYRHTFNSSTYQNAGDLADADSTTAGNQAFVTVDSTTQITLNFTDKPIPLGANNLYIAYSSASGTQIQDLWGNKLAEVTLPLEISMDVTKPAVSSVTFVDAATLKVVFSEAVDATTATTTANYVVKDSTATVKSQNSAPTFDAADTSNKTILLHFAANTLSGGSYTVDIKNVKDTSLVKNIMDAYSTTLAISDTVKPTVSNGFYVIDNTTDATKKQVTVYIPFSEAMDPTTLVKANFLREINGAGGFVALGSDDTVTVAADNKSVTIVSYNGATNWTGVDILVGAVKDPAGNGLLTFTASVAGTQYTLTSDAIALEKVEAISTTQMKVTFNGKLSAVTATGFSFIEKDTTAGGAAYANAVSVASHTVNSDNKSEVVFNLGTALSPDVLVNGNNIQLVVNAATGTKSHLGTQVSNQAAVGNAAVATADVQDKIAPSISEIRFVSATKIVVEFNEAMSTSSFALAGKNAFAVTGGTLTSALLSTGNTKKVILTGTDFTADTDVVYTAGNATDANANALATVTKDASMSTPTLVATDATVPNATATLAMTNYTATYTAVAPSADLLSAGATGITVGDFKFVASGAALTDAADDDLVVTITTAGALTFAFTDGSTDTGAVVATITITNITTGLTDTLTANIAANDSFTIDE